MHQINEIYINGQFVTPHGEELFDLFNPATTYDLQFYRAPRDEVIGADLMPDSSRSRHSSSMAWRWP